MKKPYLMAGTLLAVLPWTPVLAAAPLSTQDRTFVQQAAIGGLAEVQDGQFAVSKAQSASVRQFAQKMITDHTPNNQELMTLAQQKGVTPPSVLDAKHAQEAAALQQKFGPAFDTAYITGQVTSHQDTASVMQTEVQSGTDPDLKAFAQKTLPIVQGHLQMAQQLQTASNPAGAAAVMSATAHGGNDRAPSGSLEKYHGLLRAGELNGANVYNDQGAAIGTISDMLVSDDGKVQNAIISVGGFLGIGTHYLSVPFSELKVQQSRSNNTGIATTGGIIDPGANTLATGIVTTGSNATASPTPAPTTAVNGGGLAIGTTASGTMAPAATGNPMAAGNLPATQYFSVVLPGATKDSLTKMPEFNYRG